MTAPFGSTQRTRARFIAGALGLFIHLPGLDLRAETASDAASSTANERFGVELTLERSSLDRRAILSALEEELGVPVEERQGGVGLRLEVVGNRLEASHRDAAGRVVGRALTLPEPVEQQLEMIVLLAGNLARDEAGDVLARLRASTSSADAAPQPEVAEPAEATVAAAGESPGKPADPTTKTDVEQSTPTSDAPANEAPTTKPEPARRKSMPGSLTLFSPISTDPSLSEHEAHFDVGVLYSHMGALDGFAVNGAVSFAEDGGRGFQIAGLALFDDGPLRGVKVAGLFESGRGVEGAAIAGILSLEHGPVRGAQVSLINVAGEPSTGAQIGLINIGAAHHGAQIGLVNVQSGAARGAQIGLVNVADDMKGAPLGLVNVIPTIRTQALAWASITPTADGPARAVGPLAHVGVKYLLGHFYTQISFGVGAESNYCQGTPERCNSGDAVFAPGFGVGGRVDLTESVALELDALHQVEFSPAGALGLRNSLAARASAVWQLTDGFALFAGGGPRVDVSPDDIENERWNPTFHAGVQLF